MRTRGDRENDGAAPRSRRPPGTFPSGGSRGSGKRGRGGMRDLPKGLKAFACLLTQRGVFLPRIIGVKGYLPPQSSLAVPSGRNVLSRQGRIHQRNHASLVPP